MKMSPATSVHACTRPFLAACLVGLAAACALPAAAQEPAADAPATMTWNKGLGLKLTVQPAEFPVFKSLPPAPRLDLTLRWDNLPSPAGTVSLFAGRTIGRQPLDIPGLVPPDAEARSASDLMYVGVQFEGGARLRLKRSGDGLKLSYRASF